MSYPKPEDCRGPQLPNKTRPIVWAVVDPYLRACSASGDLRALATATEISRDALSFRRKQLDLPKLKAGRPRATKLTQREEDIMESLKTMKPSDVAREHNITPQAVHNVEQRVEEKRSIAQVIAQVCPDCHGDGSRRCTGCQGQKIHYHVCNTCAGNGRLRPPT